MQKYVLSKPFFDIKKLTDKEFLKHNHEILSIVLI